MKAYRDTDHLHASARVRALENGMVTRRDFQKMIDAKTVEEAYKVLSDAPICHGAPMQDYEQALEQNLLDAYQLLDRLAPGTGLTQLFRYQYDGHNFKTAIKSRRGGGDTSGVYSNLGNLPAKAVVAQVESGRVEGVPAPLADAALEASDVLAKTGDPQAVDILLDRGILASMVQQAEEIANPFVKKYVEAQVDIANIRAAVRLKRMGKNAFFLGKVLAPGGRIPVSAISESYTKGYDAILAVVSGSPYGRALEPAYDAIRGGGSLSLFEKLCDNALVAVLDEVRRIPFGIEPLLAFLAAKEGETKAARIVMASKLAGVPPQQITERLRDTYA